MAKYTAPIVIMLLAIIFFLMPIISGKVINGIDGNYALRNMEKTMLQESGFANWMPNYWLGRAHILPVNTKYLFRYLFPMQSELIINLIFVFSLSSLFTCLLLRKYGIGQFGSVMGGLAYGFAPHFATLIYPCHTGPLNSMLYIPMLFYALTLALGPSKAARGGSWTAVLLSGLAWGMLMNEDPQRGIYVSVAAAGYLLYNLWQSWKTRADEDSPRSIVLRMLPRIAVIGLVAFMVFFHNFQRQLGGKNVSGGAAVAEQRDSRQAAQEKWDFATSWSLNPRELADSLAPGYHGNISGDPDKPYWGSRPVAHSSDALGFFVIVFAVFGAALGFRKDGRVRFFAIAAVLATLLAFGKYMPGRPLFWLWYQLPMMDKFRAPVKFMAVTSFAAAVLSGFGLDYLMKALRENGRAIVFFKRALLIFLGIAVVWGLGLIGNQPALIADTIAPRLGGSEELAKTAFNNSLLAVLRMGIYIILSLLVVWAADRFRDFRFRVGIFGYVFALLLVFDLFTIDQFYLQKSLFEPDKFFVRDGVISTLQKDSDPFRVTTNLKFDYNGRMVPLSVNMLGNHYITFLFPYFGIESFDNTPQSRVANDYRTFFSGMLGGPPASGNQRDMIEVLLDDNIRLWRLCNVKYLVTDGHLYGLSRQPLRIMDALRARPELRLVGVVKGFAGRQQAVFEVVNALPRFAFYQNWKSAPNNSQALDILDRDDFDITRQVAVAGIGPEDGEEGQAGSAYITPRILELKPGYAKLDLDAPSDGILLVNSRFDPGWKARVDGRPQAIMPANYIMSGVNIPAGQHSLEIMYDAERRSATVSSFTILAILIFLLCLPVRKMIGGKS